MPWKTVEAPHKGQDSSSITSGRGFALKSANLMPGYNSRAPVRGGIEAAVEYEFDEDAGAIWYHPNGFLIPHDGDGLKHVSADLQTVTNKNIPTAANRPGNLGFVAVGKFVYGFGGAGLKLLRWDGSTTSPSVYANTPNNSLSMMRGVAYWLSRLWLLEQTADGSLVLRWSDQFDPATALPDTTAAWQDDVSGLTNALYLDIADGEEGCSLATVGRNLGVFTSKGIHMIRGTGPRDLVVRREVQGVGLINAMSVAQWQDGVLFLSKAGVYFYDGSRLVELSEPIRTVFENFEMTKGSVAPLGRDYFIVAVSRKLNKTSNVAWSGIVHAPSGSWTEFKSRVMSTGDYPLMVGGSIDNPVCTDKGNVYSLKSVAYPYSAPTCLDIDVFGDTRRVDAYAEWWLRLGQPDTATNITRMSVEYRQVPDGAPETDTRWEVRLRDRAANVITTLNTPDTEADTDLPSGHTILVGANEPVVRLTAFFTGPSSASAVEYAAELFSISIEHTPAQQSKRY